MNLAFRLAPLCLCLQLGACRGALERNAASLQAAGSTGKERFTGNVVPTQSGPRWRFAYGSIVVEIDAVVGERSAGPVCPQRDLEVLSPAAGAEEAEATKKHA